MSWYYHLTFLEGGTVFLREIDMIENVKYYQNCKIREWQCDPITGEKIIINDMIL